MEFASTLKMTSFGKLLAVLMILLSLDLTVGAWFFRAQQRHQQHLIENQLTSIAHLKVRQIATWRQRIRDEAALLTESPFFAIGVQQYLVSPDLENARSLLHRLRSLATHYHCPGVLLVSPEGSTVISYGPFSQIGNNNPLAELVAQAMNERHTMLSDLYADDRGGGIYLAAATPLFKNSQSGDEVLGAVVLVYDPERFLFPFIRDWPVPSETAESLLVRSDGNDALFLNELRHKSGSSLRLRIPKSSLHIPAAAALAGKTGIMRGIDYRGEKVIANIQSIPDSPWFIVTKIDEFEAFADWRGQSLLLIVAFSGIAALLVALGLAILQHNRKKHFRQLLAAEQELRQNAERSSVILMGITDGIIVTDNLGRIELLNPEAEGLTGWKNDEARGRPLSEVFTIINEKTGAKEEDSVAIVLRDGKKTAGDRRLQLVRKDRRTLPISESGAPLHDSRGDITGAVLVFRDQTETHHFEQLVEARLRIGLYAGNHALDDLLTMVLDEICVLVDSPIGFFHFVEADEKTLSLQQWSTRTLKKFCRAEGKGHRYDSSLAGVWVDCLRQRRPVIHNDYASLPNKKGLPEGHAPVVRELVVPVVSNGRVVAILGVGNKPTDYGEKDVDTVSHLAQVVYHMIEAKRIDQRLRESLQTSDDLVRAIPSGLFIYQYAPPDSLVLLDGNPEGIRITGKDIEQIIGRDFNTIWPEAQAQGITDRYLQVMRTGEMYETEELRYADDHLAGAFRIRAFVLPGSRLAVAFENITELRQSEAQAEKIQGQLQQAQKMESVGRLAGGVAHDFNNMLSVILGNTELALEQAGNNSTIQRELEEIKTAALRSADLTRQLLAFARKQVIAPKTINLNDAIEGMLKMLRRLIGEDIQLVWLPQTGLGSVFIDPSQIDQILANLSVNARDAISGMGKITIETGTISLADDYCQDNPGFLPGEYITLSFSDNGSGIAREHLKNIFEPFFTTKKLGEGTGLGLAMIYGIVKQNGGFIKVYSEPEKGTTFRIYLPQYAKETPEAKDTASLDIPKGRGELVLLVEDETLILEMNVRMLERLGYRVLATSSASEAILLAKEHKAQLRLLFTDIVMPEMNGRDLAKAILSTHPELKCLFMSGYTANVIARQGFLPEGTNFLQKPFTKRDLALKLNKIFNE